MERSLKSYYTIKPKTTVKIISPTPNELDIKQCGGKDMPEFFATHTMYAPSMTADAIEFAKQLKDFCLELFGCNIHIKTPYSHYSIGIGSKAVWSDMQMNSIKRLGVPYVLYCNSTGNMNKIPSVYEDYVIQVHGNYLAKELLYNMDAATLDSLMGATTGYMVMEPIVRCGTFSNIHVSSTVLMAYAVNAVCKGANIADLAFDCFKPRLTLKVTWNIFTKPCNVVPVCFGCHRRFDIIRPVYVPDRKRGGEYEFFIQSFTKRAKALKEALLTEQEGALYDEYIQTE